MSKTVKYTDLVEDKLDAFELERVMRLLYAHGNDIEINLSPEP
jgi:hypothetical protein